MSFDEFMENFVNDNSSFKKNGLNEKSVLLSKNNINTLLYSYFNNSNIKNNFMMLNEKTNRHVISKLYAIFNKFFKLCGKNIDISMLKEFEDKVYTVNGFTLTNNQRIKYELSKIKSANNQKSEFEKDIYQLIEQVEKIISNLNNDDVIKEIKKIIVLLQILTSRSITFYESAYELFLEYCENLNFVFNKEVKDDNNNIDDQNKNNKY